MLIGVCTGIILVMRLTMLLRVVSQEAIKMEMRVQAGLFGVKSLFSPAKAPTND